MSRGPHVRAHLDGTACGIGCTICVAIDGKRAFEKSEAAERMNRSRRKPEPAPSKTDHGGKKKPRYRLPDAGIIDPGPETLTREEYLKKQL